MLDFGSKPFVTQGEAGVLFVHPCARAGVYSKCGSFFPTHFDFFFLIYLMYRHCSACFCIYLRGKFSMYTGGLGVSRGEGSSASLKNQSDLAQKINI